ncbi:MAG: hypothetical protein ACKVOR_00105, partial [Flavobacteriales bacterium]
MKISRVFFLLLALIFSLFACNKDGDDQTDDTATQQPRLIFKFKFDTAQVRLNELGMPEVVPAGNAAQHPDFNYMSAHYIELTPSAFTALGTGSVLYHAPQTNAGGADAIDFQQSVLVGEDEVFQSFKLSDLTPGTYEYLRVSLAYQNYDIMVRQSGLDFPATVASFIGFNTYITDYEINTESVDVNDDKLQGYWGVEANVLGTPYVVTGQAPPGATTVPNPLFATSAVPAGSCVVTGEFASPLVITGSETEDIVVIISLSTNRSFEWT